MGTKQQLISYIAPGAPATRRPVTEKLAFLRPEIGFTPRWYNRVLGIDFGECWHTDPSYRLASRIKMYNELARRFSSYPVGRIDSDTIDIVTGTFGTTAIASIYGIPVRYNTEQWPTSEHKFLSDEEIENITPPDLDKNSFFLSLLKQIDFVLEHEGKITGFMNWQGVLNNAQRIRGQKIFTDMYINPARTMHLLDCICTTMIEAAKRFNLRKSCNGDSLAFATVSNCLVNLVNPEMYCKFLLPFDQKIAEAFDVIGIHNCAWTADPYLGYYAKIQGVAYMDMGIDSDLDQARRLFPDARRAIMYTPMDITRKRIHELRNDLEQIARRYGPCDIVAADIDYGTSDSKLSDLIEICEQISEEYI